MDHREDTNLEALQLSLGQIINSDDPFRMKKLMLSEQMSNSIFVGSLQPPVEWFLEILGVLSDMLIASSKIRRLYLALVIRSLAEDHEIPLESCRRLITWFRKNCSPDGLDGCYLTAIEVMTELSH